MEAVKHVVIDPVGRLLLPEKKSILPKLHLSRLFAHSFEGIIRSISL